MDRIIPSFTKICAKCKGNFIKKSCGQNSTYCSDCYSNYRKERREKGIDILTPNQAHDRNLRSNYGITRNDYLQMFEQQGGACAVCGKRETRLEPRTKQIKNLCVDHCHKTGRVRALLCSECNTALGMLKEDPKRIQALMKYAKGIEKDRIQNKDMPGNQLRLF